MFSRTGNPFLRKPLWAVLDEDWSEHIKSSQNSRHSINHGDDNPSTKSGLILSDGDNNCIGDSNATSAIHAQEKLTVVKKAQPLTLPRHLTLFDLVCIGVGGTIGSGIFVINGLIAHSYAGPATFLCWIISGFTALLSGCCYAELSSRIPSTGSSYAYAFVTLGELPAFLVAGMLTLEFLLSGSAVARSWGDKVVEWSRVQLSARDSVIQLLQPGYNINPLACILSIATTTIVMAGVKESKIVTTIFTWLKVILVIFMIAGGYALFNPSNLKPFIPPEFGASGILHGAISSFFGYLGFDAMCCVAGEAINPRKNLPLSIIITMGVVAILYVAAALSLVGMQHYTEISPESGFPMAFKARGIEWASNLTAAGEVFTLPVVVLVSFAMQPRLQFALANDGLLPPMFGELDSKGSPRKGAFFAGALMTIFATFIPFTSLDDFISAGILIAFTVTNCSLVIIRFESQESNLGKLLGCFNTLSFITCLVLSHGLHYSIGWPVSILLGLLSIFSYALIHRHCRKISWAGKNNVHTAHFYDNEHFFITPLVPAIPCLGMFLNYLLISRLSFLGIGLIVLYMVLLIMIYILYGQHQSVTRSARWICREYSMVGELQNDTNGLSKPIPAIT